MVPVGISQNDFLYKYFLTKMKTIIMCFQLSTFNINVKDIKSMDKLILRNIVGHYQGGWSTENFLPPISSFYL